MRNKLFDSLTDERGGENDQSAIARYTFTLPYIKHKRVLDIGCGLGLGPQIFAKSQAEKVLAIDYSNTAINYAKKIHECKNLRYKLLDANNISLLKEKFDVVTSFELLEHLPQNKHKSFLKNISHLLNKKGLCVLSTPNILVYSKGDMKSSNPFHKHEYTYDELNTLCKKYFARVVIKGVVIKNKTYYDHKKNFESTINSKFINLLCKYKLTHQLLGIVPKHIKNLITRKHKAPIIRSTDYRLTSKNIHLSDSFFVLCRKE